MKAPAVQGVQLFDLVYARIEDSPMERLELPRLLVKATVPCRPRRPCGVSLPIKRVDPLPDEFITKVTKSLMEL